MSAEPLTFCGQGILLDVEGTTSSIAYVVDVLFPYARLQLRHYLEAHWDHPEVAQVREMVAKDAGASAIGNDSLSALVEHLTGLMDRDAKTTGLKELQGLIWRDGFECGELRAHVFPDVPPALADWQRRGLDVRIYSSGSVLAQKLFFGHTEAGDLTPYLNGHYDTTTGPKRVVESYRAIAAAMNLPTNAVLFISDVAAELDAARTTGMITALALRPGNAPVSPDHGHPVLSDFRSIAFG